MRRRRVGARGFEAGERGKEGIGEILGGAVGGWGEEEGEEISGSLLGMRGWELVYGIVGLRTD